MLSPVAISKMTNDDAYDLAQMFALWSAVDIKKILKALVVALKFVTDESYWGEFFYGLAGTQYHKGELESLVTTFEKAIICNTTDEIYLQYDKARVLKELGGRRAEIEVCCDRILELGLGDQNHEDEIHSMIYDVLPVNPKYISRYTICSIGPFQLKATLYFSSFHHPNPISNPLHYRRKFHLTQVFERFHQDQTLCRKAIFSNIKATPSFIV